MQHDIGISDQSLLDEFNRLRALIEEDTEDGQDLSPELEEALSKLERYLNEAEIPFIPLH